MKINREQTKPRLNGFDYQKFAKGLNCKASLAVKKEFDSKIPLNMEEIETLIMIFPDSHLWYESHCNQLDDCYNEAIYHKIGIIQLDENDLNLIMDLLERIANTKEQINLLHTLTNWYGYKRAILPRDNVVPKDDRPGIYSKFNEKKNIWGNNIYDGTTDEEFIRENITPIEVKLYKIKPNNFEFQVKY